VGFRGYGACRNESRHSHNGGTANEKKEGKKNGEGKGERGKRGRQITRKLAIQSGGKVKLG